MKTMHNDPFYELFEFKPRKSDIKKLEMIEASISCLATLGLEKTTYEAVAKKVKTNRAHVNYYFSSKKELFTDSVKYILSTYQNISIEKISKRSQKNNMLQNYIEAVFDWAHKHPEQLSVMFLLYYMCRVDEDYKKIHHEIRSNGLNKITNLIVKEMNLEKKKALSLAKLIQNLVTGSIIDAATTEGKTILKAKKSTIDQIQTFLKFN